MLTKKEWNRIQGDIQEGRWTPDVDFELSLLGDIWGLWDRNEALEADLEYSENEIDRLESDLEDASEAYYALEEKLDELRDQPVRIRG